MNPVQFHDTRKRWKMNARLEIFLLSLATAGAFVLLVANVAWH